MVNEDGKIEIGVGVNTEELDKYSKKLDKILKQMQQVNGTTVKSTSSVNNLDDKFKKLTETSNKISRGNGSIGLSLSPLLNKIPMYSKLSGSLGNVGSGVNWIKELVSFGRDNNRGIQNKTERLSKSFEKLSTKTNVAQARLGAVAEKGGVVGKAAGGLSKGFSKFGPLMTRISGLIARVGVALGPIGIALGVVAGGIGGVILAITGLIGATAVATKKMKEFASTADNLVKERRSYDPTTATEAGAYRQGLIRQTGKLADKLGRLATTLANQDVIKFGGTLDIMTRRYRNVDDALDRHANTTMRITALMDTLGMYLDTLRMGVLDLIEPIISNTKFLKGLATAIDWVITPFMWIGKGLSIFAGVLGDALSAIGSFVFGVMNFVTEIPILGDFVKDALKVLDMKSSHIARDFVDDMENVFKKYKSGYAKDPYKLNTGLHNLSFMDYWAERSPADNDVHTDDKEITDVSNNSLMHLLKTNFLKFTKPLLDFGFELVGKIVERLDSIFTFIKNTANTIFNFWTTLFQEAQGIVTKAKTFFEGIVANVITFFDGIVTNVKTFFEGIVTKAKTFFDGIVTRAKTFFKPLLDGINTIGTLINNVINAIKDITINIPFIGSSSSSSSSKKKKNKDPLPEPTISPDPFNGKTPKGSEIHYFGPPEQKDKHVPSKSKGKLTGYSGESGNSNSNSVASSISQASKKTTPPAAYLKNSMSFAQVPYSNSNAFALPGTQASASARNSNKSLELSNSHRLPYPDRSKELKILDPRNVDIKININTEKADKDFVEKMTEKLKKSFLEGLLYDY